jgi:hypothetical protein
MEDSKPAQALSEDDRQRVLAAAREVLSQCKDAGLERLTDGERDRLAWYLAYAVTDAHNRTHIEGWKEGWAEGWNAAREYAQATIESAGIKRAN